MISERRKPSQLSQAKVIHQAKPPPKKPVKSIRPEPNLNCLKHISPIITARILEQDIHKKKIQSLRNSPQRVKFQQKRSTIELMTKKSANRNSMNRERLSMKASIQRGKVKSALSEANHKKKKKKPKKAITKQQTFRWEENQILSKRYQLRELIGKGAFGQVIRAVDLHQNCFVAIKIIANKKKVNQQAQNQIQILRLLNKIDIFSKRRSVVLLKDHFKARGHMVSC